MQHVSESLQYFHTTILDSLQGRLLPRYLITTRAIKTSAFQLCCTMPSGRILRVLLGQERR